MTARMLSERKPDAVMHVGIAGARELEALTLVLGSEAVYEDRRGRHGLPRLAPDPALFERIRGALPDALVLPIGTSGTVGGASACDVEAMEGFAVLRACELAGVPAVELRAISNSPDEEDRSKWRFDEAFAALAEAVARVLSSAS